MAVDPKLLLPVCEDGFKYRYV